LVVVLCCYLTPLNLLQVPIYKLLDCAIINIMWVNYITQGVAICRCLKKTPESAGADFVVASSDWEIPYPSQSQYELIVKHMHRTLTHRSGKFKASTRLGRKYDM
jgi:hypothetical protein